MLVSALSHPEMDGQIRKVADHGSQTAHDEGDPLRVHQGRRGNQEIGGSDYCVVARYGYAVDRGLPRRSLSGSLAEGLGPESGPFPFADFLMHLPA